MPFVACVGKSYFRVLSVCLLFVCFVNAAGCHCLDFLAFSKLSGNDPCSFSEDNAKGKLIYICSRGPLGY